MNFQLKSDFSPKGDQPKAINEIIDNFNNNKEKQVLLGATATGKTFTIANIIQKLNKQTLVLVHNKTLAMQLFVELKNFFPNNKVEYFISFFDFYNPEAYIVSSDVYVSKVSAINKEIKMMRRSTQNSLLTRNDTIVVASVSAIYGLDDPKQYYQYFFRINQGLKISRSKFFKKLVEVGYQRNANSTEGGNFTLKGQRILIYPGWTQEYYLEVYLELNTVTKISTIDSFNHLVLNTFLEFVVFPASNFLLDRDFINKAVQKIAAELKIREQYFKKANKLVELQRISERTKQDIEKIKEFGTCSGIENYSAVFEGRKPNEPPFTLFDYFQKDFLTIIDESHITIPQLQGMYKGDYQRKKNLVDYGFRLPSALDNRPLRYQEVLKKFKKTIFLSATPSHYEFKLANNCVVEQIIRPTGLVDPIVTVLSRKNQVEDLLMKLKEQKKINERSFVITLTIQLAEDLTFFLQKHNVKAAYLHSKLKTLERTKILNDLRRGIYDVVVGINLLREGLDLPEISLIAIFDADKEGFLRNTRSLIQIIGRAARNTNGKVFMYADTITKSMKEAILETKRRRKIQQDFNIKHHIVPKTIKKAIVLNNIENKVLRLLKFKEKNKNSTKLEQEQAKLVRMLKINLKKAVKNLEFEKAAQYRDMILEIDSNFKL